MRDGFKIFDADTHIKPSVESVTPYIAAGVLERIPNLEEQLTPIRIGMAGEKYEAPFRHLFRFGTSVGGWGRNKPRVLGEAGPREGAQREFQTFMGSRLPTDGGGDWDAQVRLKDMDEEGSDVHFIVHTAGGGHPDPEIEREFVRADHRYMNDFCGADSSRLKSCITVTPEDIELSIDEIKRWGPERWAVAIHPHLPVGYPLDHPDMNPIWAAACDYDLAVIHHSFAAGYPGYRDLWDNPFLGRLAGHPWGAMRAVAAFFGSGIMDRFPTIRYGILESGFGWLPFWAKRMDDQAVYMGHVADNLQHKLSEYMTGGRFFAATVLHEGEDIAEMVTQQLGDHVLMFGSDYPHSESRFPESVATVLDWDSLDHETMRKMLWDNPVRFFGEP
jgi:predicted TIM-barrel fold metal-dependent hydrolase